MMLLGFFVGLFIVCVIIIRYTRSFSNLNFIAEVIACVIFIVVQTIHIGLGVGYLATKGDIESFKATKVSIVAARENINIESAALQNKIVEKNEWLAKVKYQNSLPIIEISIPDEVDTLEPIE